jgi:predicted metal-dependent phosphoesterase TrpH
MSRVDLHVHSTASDGRFSPVEVVRLAAERGLSFLALADHDTVAGTAPALAAARDFPGLTVIPAVELSTDIPEGEVHVLGYFIDYTDCELLAKLEKMRNSREERARAMVDRLGTLGIDIRWLRVKEIAGSGSVGRPHLAQAMLEQGCASSFEEAFTEYIGRGAPAYVERRKMTPVAAVRLILQAKGLPVLAHPLTAGDYGALLPELAAAGLVGIEAHYKDYDADTVARLLDLAERYGLVATGGSDYHGLGSAGEVMLGGVEVPLSAAEDLLALADQRSAGVK